MVDNPADIAYDKTGMTSPTTYGGYDYGAAVQAEAPVSDGRGQAEILERQGGTSAQDGNRPGVPGTLGEERGNLRQLYLRERHTVSSAPELYRIEDCVTPAAGSEVERIQSRFRKEYGLGCYMVKNSAWSIKHDACFEDGIIYFREGIAPRDFVHACRTQSNARHETHQFLTLHEFHRSCTGHDEHRNRSITS